MKRLFSCFPAVCMALMLAVPAFADVLPPMFYEVTVGDHAIPRYRLDQTDGAAYSMVKDGSIPAGTRIRVLNEMTVSGKTYGAFQERQIVSTPGGSAHFGGWETYYFLLDDVRSPYALTTDDRDPTVTEEHTTEVLPTITLPPTTPATTKPQPSVTAVRPETTTADPAPAETTQTQTEETTVSETDMQSSAATTETESSAVTDEPDTGIDRQTPSRILPICIVASVVLALTAVVTLALIRRKRSVR